MKMTIDFSITPNQEIRAEWDLALFDLQFCTGPFGDSEMSPPERRAATITRLLEILNEAP